MIKISDMSDVNSQLPQLRYKLAVAWNSELWKSQNCEL